MLWYLLGEYVKTTILLVYSICTVHRFFFPSHRFVLFFYSIFALFIRRFSLFIYRSILVSHFFFFFFFSLLFVLFFFPFLYIIIQCFCAVHLQCHFIEPFCLFFFFFFNSSYDTKLVYSTLLSQNLLFHIIFLGYLFVYFFLYTLF